MILTYLGTILSHFDEIKTTKLYSLLKNIPKGVMHHNHFPCNQDEEFVKIYLASSKSMLSMTRESILISLVRTLKWELKKKLNKISGLT